MPGNLSQLILHARRRSAVDAVRPTRTVSCGYIHYHPRYRNWLVRCGIDSSETAMSLPGEIVCGHPDRHVVKVDLGHGTGKRVAFLKREHVVGLRVRLQNRLAGFGPVSRAEREAMILRQLEQAGLPGPQWFAYGEDAHGHGFLLVDQVAGGDDLRTVLQNPSLSGSERKQVIEAVGRTIAELHSAGFSTPDLAAKHVLVNPETFAVTLLDWQSSRTGQKLSVRDRTRQLAGLSASLSEELASVSERLRFLWVYRRTLRHANALEQNSHAHRFGRMAQAIESCTQRLCDRSSSRDQRASTTKSQQRLLWLEGETVCVIPEMRDLWPYPVSGHPFYQDVPSDSTRACQEEWLTFADNTRAILQRFQSFAPLARLVAMIRERPWRSPATRQARVLFHLERHGIDGPRLLGFGQRLLSQTCADSFVVFEPLPNSQSLFDRLDDLPAHSDERRTLLREVGTMLRKLHNVRCRLGCVRPGDAVFLASVSRPLQLAVESPSSVRLVKKVRTRGRVSDFARLCRIVLPGFSRPDYLRIAHGYTATGHNTRSFCKRLLAGVM